MTRRAGRPRASIAGLGITEMGRVYGRTAVELAAEAVALAAEDAGIRMQEIDGLLTNSGVGLSRVGLPLQHSLQMQNLSLLSEVQAYGSSAGAMVQYASMAIESGMAQTVACVFADAPLSPGLTASDVYNGSRLVPAGYRATRLASGVHAAPTSYALAASRHMARFGTTSEQLGAVAVAARQWAQMNPRAQMRTPISLEDHQASRFIADPLHLLDCCLVSNGAVAVIVTSAERARALRQPVVDVIGWGQGHPDYPMARGSEFGLVSGAATSGATAFAMAGIKVTDVDIAEIYDCFTFTTLISLEDYGFCEKGEGGPFVASGALAPSGGCPTNTGGGQLSSYYMWGMTPLSEAVIQARGQAETRQVPAHGIVLVSGNGGVLDYHSTLILSSN